MISQNMNWARYVVCVKEIRMAFQTSLENPEGKGPFQRPSHRDREYYA